MRSVFCAILLVIVAVRGQFVPASPCPEMFTYENDGRQVYGMIKYQPSGHMSTLTIRANFSIRAVLPSDIAIASESTHTLEPGQILVQLEPEMNQQCYQFGQYVGQIDVLGEKQSVLQNLLRGEPLHYRVRFPITSPLPKLTALIANNDIVCVGQSEFAGPGEVLTSISLNHMLYAEGEPSRPSYNTVISRPNRPNSPNINIPATILLEDGNTFDIGANNFNFDGDSKEPSYTINTITIPNRNDNGNNQFAQYFPSNSNSNTISEQPNTQFQQRPPVIQQQIPQQRPQQFPQQTSTIQQQFPQQTPAIQQQFPQQTPAIQQFPQQTPSIQQQFPQQTPPIQQPFPQQSPSTQQQIPQQIPPTQQQFPQEPVVQPNRQPTGSNECGVVSGGQTQVSLVYHGTSVSRGEWPWLTALYVKRGNGVHYNCAGSLVSHQHVITAAHCMHEKTAVVAMSQFVVKTGAFNLDSWSDAVIRGLKAATIHDAYNPQTLENDLLLLTLDAPVEFSVYNHPVCLWEGETNAAFIAGQHGTVVGWGLNEIRGSGQGEPRMASVPIVTTETCRASRVEFHKLTSSNTLCAGDRNGTGPCNGDSGGGLYMFWGGRWRLRGVVSVSLRPVTGEARCNLNEYVVFTDVAQYLPWLIQHMAG